VTTWRPVSTDPPAVGSRVLVRDGEEVRTVTWSGQSAKRFEWWLPREVLP
jgi:hypothetical protein